MCDDANNDTQMTRQYYIAEVQVFDRVTDIPFTLQLLHLQENINNVNTAKKQSHKLIYTCKCYKINDLLEDGC